jgi:hypothetical protein
MPDRTRSSTIIQAPPASVMAVIADFAAYPEWASAVKSAEVTEAGSDGRARRVRFRLDAGVIRDSYVLVYEWDADTQVSWRLAEPTAVLSVMSGSYLLSDRDPGTEVTYELAVAVRIPMLGMVKRRAEKMIIDTALKGLRKRVEKLGEA